MNFSASPDPRSPHFGRREMLKSLSSGFGYLAFAGLATQASQAAAPPREGPLAPKASHFPARAKHVIFLCMRGGPSHVDTFDYKPKLSADSGAAGQRPGTKLLGSKWNFAQHGQSGLWISELFPNVANHADDLCVLRSMQTDLPSHPQAFLQMHTGSFQFVRPSLGAWTLYGLGTENENLPGFVTLTPPGASGGAQNYGSSFLPAIYQGTRLGTDTRPIAGAQIRNLKSPLNSEVQRAELDLVQTLNRESLRRDQFNPAVEGVIESYELAFRMQKEMPQVMDIEGESAATKKLYGLENTSTADFGRKCLLARRFVEAGVRFVEISHGDWDQHFNLTSALGANCRSVDQPIAALLTDLKERGLLKDTLVIWGGEFGRTPHAQGGDGRDHNNKAFTMWMAGGGVKGGFAHGMTDDYGYEAIDNKMHVHDLHATILHLLGLDHEKLTYRYAGRDFRLTDVHGHVVKEIIA
ncbi:DUF1501 domain-containing protein [Phragmitibacter flavus]|uniref:DUF1501 domain-containing protein n=1 Tax=Phragmitibacter flavus TaxID=2576071 RepID=A0A5R8KH62_9BACT|nr:DUF1501 domain-containing protein [Phragmitibacter flavus]TLD70949.1 DUF1501 domain-containing protein [Phragmitibacter flavus]